MVLLALKSYQKIIFMYVYMKEVEESLNNGFIKMSSEISRLRAKLNHLDKNFENLQKTTFNTIDSTDFSVEILSVTPSKTKDEKTMKKIDKKIKKYGMLLDISEGIRRHKQVVKSYDPFVVVDHGKREAELET
ncbi:hypothetical protein Bca101_081269 [Brassica carinata]